MMDMFGVCRMGSRIAELIGDQIIGEDLLERVAFGVALEMFAFCTA
jgi:hypothetical protein